MLQRTQLLLDKETKHDLIILSQLKNQTLSQLLRNLLTKKIPTEKKKHHQKSIDGVKIMLQMAESTKRHHLKGPKDLSKNHDYYLYGYPPLPTES